MWCHLRSNGAIALSVTLSAGALFVECLLLLLLLSWLLSSLLLMLMGLLLKLLLNSLRGWTRPATNAPGHSLVLHVNHVFFFMPEARGLLRFVDKMHDITPGMFWMLVPECLCSVQHTWTRVTVICHTNNIRKWNLTVAKPGSERSLDLCTHSPSSCNPLSCASLLSQTHL